MRASYAGIDAGSLYLKIVRTDEQGGIVGGFYAPHYGDAAGLLRRELAGFDGEAAVTGSKIELDLAINLPL